MAEEAGLSGLPPEVFEQVAELVPEKDLLALRLAWRSTAAKTHRTFIKAHFSRKAFLVDSPSSIRLALTIARHPAFGPALREIILLIDQIHNSPGAPIVIETQQARAAFQHLRRQLWADHQQFRNKQRQQNAMLDLFKQLKQLGKVDTIRIIQSPQTDLAPVFDKTVGSLRSTKFNFTENNMLWPCKNVMNSVELILEAINQSAVDSVQEICMKTISPLELNTLSAQTTTIYQDTFSSLKSLTLSTLIVSEDYQDKPFGYIQQFCNAITQSPLLEHLDIEFATGVHGWQDNNDDATLVQMLMQKTLPSLKTLRLNWPTVEMDKLLHFIIRQPSMKKLILDNTYIWETSFLQFAQYREQVDQLLLRLTHLEEVVTNHDTEWHMRGIWP